MKYFSQTLIELVDTTVEDMSTIENLIRRIKKKSQSKTDISANTNIFWRLLNMSQDVARFISFTTSLFKKQLAQLRFPFSLINIALQAVVVLFDKNYSNKLKVGVLTALSLMVLITIGIWSLAPTLTILLIGLTTGTHFIGLFYRASKFKTNLDNYLFPAQEPTIEKQDTLFNSVIERYKTLKRLIHNKEQQESIDQTEKELEDTIEEYCRSTADQEKIRFARLRRAVDSGIGVVILSVRWIAAVLLLTLATTTPVLVVPLMVITFCCNAGDFIRNLYSKIQNMYLDEEHTQKQIDLVESLDSIINDNDEEKSDYHLIIQMLSPTITPRSINNPKSTAENNRYLPSTNTETECLNINQLPIQNITSYDSAIGLCFTCM